MKSIPLSDDEITALRGALEIAREKYDENAKTLRSIPGQDRLADQFDRQATAASDLLDKLEY